MDFEACDLITMHPEAHEALSMALHKLGVGVKIVDGLNSVEVVVSDKDGEILCITSRTTGYEELT